MHIDKLILGAFENNCYIVRANEESANCIIIDTALTVEPLIDLLKRKNLIPQAVILTHGHIDHIAGVNSLRENFNGVKVCIHKADSYMLSDSVGNLSALAGIKVTVAPPDIVFEKEEQIKFADLEFQIIHTPGHTAGGICLYNKDEKILFSGDTLFAASIGRTDFLGYNSQKYFEQLVNSIKSKLFILPDDTKVLPGHGEETTVKREKLYNPYLR